KLSSTARGNCLAHCLRMRRKARTRAPRAGRDMQTLGRTLGEQLFAYLDQVGIILWWEHAWPPDAESVAFWQVSSSLGEPPFSPLPFLRATISGLRNCMLIPTPAFLAPNPSTAALHSLTPTNM